MTCKIIPFPITRKLIQRKITRELLDDGYPYNDHTCRSFDNFVIALVNYDPLIKKVNNSHEKINQITVWCYEFDSVSIENAYYNGFSSICRKKPKPHLTLVKN